MDAADADQPERGGRDEPPIGQGQPTDVATPSPAARTSSTAAPRPAIPLATADGVAATITSTNGRPGNSGVAIAATAAEVATTGRENRWWVISHANAATPSGNTSATLPICTRLYVSTAPIPRRPMTRAASECHVLG